ncbi:MAG TPA: alkaline phosphatase family protein [Thermoanaerobaculia bacterium]|nr:alkaline phosphatase family protein [Thermoanaerobaculia bacterium]
MSVDDLRAQLRERGYLSHGIERWFALDPWRSRAFWVELTIVSAKAAILMGAFSLLPLVAIMLFRNHPLSAWETLLLAIAYGGSAVMASFALLIVVALILKIRPALAIDTPRALLAISFTVSAVLSAAIAVWWSRFASPPALAELMVGLVLIVMAFLIGTLAISAALLSFSIYELQRVPAIHQRPRGAPMSMAAAILVALLFLPAYAAQDRQTAQTPMAVVTTPRMVRVALIAVDGLTFEIARTRTFPALQAIATVPGNSTTERWASVGTGVPPRMHGVHAVDGVRVRGGRHLIQTLSSADVVLHDLAPAVKLADREPLPPTVRRRDFVWEIFAARGVTTLSVNWWTTDDSATSIGQASIFAAAKGDPLQLDAGATRRALSAIDRSHPQFVALYLPALDVILNRLALDRSAQVAQSVRALDGVAAAVEALQSKGYDVMVVGLPGDRQSGKGMLATAIPLREKTASAYDVAPTLCALMGFPASAEMPGSALVPSELPAIASYGPRAGQSDDVKVNEEYYNNLKSLGYIR